jgi:2-oxoglutarate ferredoxin oxidoreductase subunit beta
LIEQALAHPGFSLVDVLQPCVSFNPVNTYSWYKKRCYELPPDYDPGQWAPALEKAGEWGERIPVGVLFRQDRPTYESHFSVLSSGSLQRTGIDPDRWGRVLKKFQ